MKKSIKTWFNDANIESDKLCEFFIILNIGWFYCCMWAAAADSDLSLKHDLITELVIKWACDDILFAIWFVKISNTANINYLKIYFLITDKMKIFDNHMK